MPLETIKCQECGSADVTEFKAGSYVCGHCEAVFKHVDPAGSSSCSCGTFAIGRCAECNIPVCAEHSQVYDWRRLCEQHLVAVRATDAARRQKAHVKSTAETIVNRIRAWDDWLDAARGALAESSDPSERVVRVVAALQGGELRSQRRDEPKVLPPLLLPDILQGAPATSCWWDRDAVQAWFLRSVKVPPDELGVVNVRRTLFGETRREQTTAPGWSFPEGSTALTGGPGGYPLTVCVLTDGRRLLGASTEGGQSIGFNERVLAQMAEMAQLDPLPQFPAMSYDHPETGERVWPSSRDRSSGGGAASS